MDSITSQWRDLAAAGRHYSALDPPDYRRQVDRLSSDLFIRVLRSHAPAGAAVLEPGCGSALYSFTLARLGFRVTALDISERIISDLARIRHCLDPGIACRIEFVVGDIFHLDRLKRRFDLVFNHGVYEHWLDPGDRGAVLESIRSVLPAGGKYVIAVPNLRNPLFRFCLSSGNVPPMAEFSAARLRDELRRHAFAVLESGGLFVSPSFHQWLRSEAMAYPITSMAKLYSRFPRLLKSIFSAHLYCVGVLNRQQCL
jgi:SAM-dependent methyltransferase